MEWFKMVCNILDHRKIKMIRKGPEGNTLVLLWLLMLAEAGKCNRGGYLMISDSLQYTAETLGMITDIPMPTVQLGLRTYSCLGMIDQQDGVIFIKNWSKYQSEDKLEARREKDRERKTRQRQRERKKILALPVLSEMSRDGHDGTSRDVMEQNRTEKHNEETTTEQLRLLLSGTPMIKISDQELEALMERHGFELLSQAADVAAETWRRNREEKYNPGGYLQKLCSSLVLPAWYVPIAKRTARAEESHQRKAEEEVGKNAKKAEEEARNSSINALWESLSEDTREMYRSEVSASMRSSNIPEEFLPEVSITEMAKKNAWEAIQPKKHS